MAITQCLEWLDRDTRFKSWGRTIKTAADVDISKERGYALSGEWVKWTASVAVGDNEFLVAAAETGSRARRGYSYQLVEGSTSGECRVVEGDEMRAVIDGALEAGQIDEGHVAKSKNSELYLYALYCHLRFTGFAVPCPTARTAEAVEAEIRECEERLAVLRAELESLTAGVSTQVDEG